MNIALITGSSGLIGSEAVRFFYNKGYKITGIDNDMRSAFFGEDASTKWNRKLLEKEIKGYTHYNIDIRNERKICSIFKEYGANIKVIIHTAAQPSHDWAADNPSTDFSINATGTLILLENMRNYAPDSCFIYISTNKVYGDSPNRLPLTEHETRWEIDSSHPFFERGIDESMSIDQSKHSLFGVSKTSADLLVQEYGRYFGMNTVCFRGGCLTGPSHSGTMLHGFLSYLMKCAITGEHYTIYGYKGKQVRDNIHSYDLVNMFWHFYKNPGKGEVYNAGGGRYCNCSIIEAISLCEKITGKKMKYSYCEDNRQGDHIWWISDVSKFKSHYPEWSVKYDINMIIAELYQGFKTRACCKTK